MRLYRAYLLSLRIPSIDDLLSPIHSDSGEEETSGLGHRVLMALIILHKYFLVSTLGYLWIRNDLSFYTGSTSHIFWRKSFLSIFLSPLKPNAAAFWFRRGHKLSDSFKNNLELGIVFLFQFIESFGQFFVGGKHLARLNKCPHNLDITLSLFSMLESIA